MKNKMEITKHEEEEMDKMREKNFILNFIKGILRTLEPQILQTIIKFINKILKENVSISKTNKKQKIYK